MFPLAFLGQYAALVKTAVYALLAILAGLLGLNYARRGQKIEEQKRQIKELNVKADVTAKNVTVNEDLQKKEQDIEKKTNDELLDEVNKLHK